MFHTNFQDYAAVSQIIFMTQGTLHAQPKLPPTNPHETLETQEAVSGDDFTLHPHANQHPTTKYLAVLLAARSYKNQLDRAELSLHFHAHRATKCFGEWVKPL